MTEASSLQLVDIPATILDAIGHADSASPTAGASLLRSAPRDPESILVTALGSAADTPQEPPGMNPPKVVLA